MGGKVLKYKARVIYEEGMEKGIEKGIKKGIEKGIEQGIGQGALNTVINLVKKGIITTKDAAEELGISEEELNKKLAG